MDVLIPLQLEYEVPPPIPPARPVALIGIAATTILAGMLVGASSNAINGIVSPTYFINVLGWQGVPNVWSASIVQGLFEGSVLGAVLSAIFTTTIGIVTRATCPYRMGLNCLGRILLAVYVFWGVGGIVGMLLADFNSHYFQSTFTKVPNGHTEMLKFAWVGGSIWGAYIGGPLAFIVGLGEVRIHWRRYASATFNRPARPSGSPATYP